MVSIASLSFRRKSLSELCVRSWQSVDKWVVTSCFINQICELHYSHHSTLHIHDVKCSCFVVIYFIHATWKITHRDNIHCVNSPPAQSTQENVTTTHSSLLQRNHTDGRPRKLWRPTYFHIQRDSNSVFPDRHIACHSVQPMSVYHAEIAEQKLLLSPQGTRYNKQFLLYPQP